MSFDFINSFQSCYDYIISDIPVSLVYYSHIPSALVALFLGVFILSKNKTLISRIIFFIAVVFSVWSFIDIILWTSLDSQNYVFFWSLTVILETLLFILNLYLIFVFATKKDVTLNIKIVFLFLLLPILLFTSTKYNIGHFDSVECLPIDNVLYPYFALPIRGLLSILFIYIFINLFRKLDNDIKKQFNLISTGSFLFLLFFFFSNIFGTFLIDRNIIGTIDAYKIEMYSLFTMPVFLGLLVFLIVRFKTFNIKLLGAQALVWALIILVGSQFLYLADMSVTSTILTSITLILSAGIGLLVVRSVRQVDEQREMLDIANKNQESMLHFITHQIKGFMTKTRGIYAGILEGDYGEINGKVQAIVQYGLESETKGVDTIQNILNASNLKSGKIVFDKKEFDLTAMVKSIIEDFRKKIADKGLELEENISAKPIIFNGDELRIKEVLKNLLDNSIHYTEQGKVSVTLKILGDKIKYSIKDTGIGLSNVDRKNLFQEGGRGEVSLTHNVESTGYGLFIAKKIVEEHKGKVWAESEGRDKGSEFIVELPIK